MSLNRDTRFEQLREQIAASKRIHEMLQKKNEALQETLKETLTKTLLEEAVKLHKTNFTLKQENIELTKELHARAPELLLDIVKSVELTTLQKLQQHDPQQLQKQVAGMKVEQELLTKENTILKEKLAETLRSELVKLEQVNATLDKENEALDAKAQQLKTLEKSSSLTSTPQTFYFQSKEEKLKDTYAVYGSDGNYIKTCHPAYGYD